MQEVLAWKPDARILVFGPDSEMLLAKKFMQAGAMGYLDISSSGDEITQAFENILENKKYLNPALLESLVHDVCNEKFTNPFRRLSIRELEILPYLVKGSAVTDISNWLDLGQSTISTYKARILKKLNCSSIDDISSLARNFNFSF
jgi:DNA-binding NarL/FixJ family response regulator